MPAWHPNFRNFDRLPDTKVVRTSFFVNGVAVLIAVSLTIYTVYREVDLHAMRADAASAIKEIEANKPTSDQAVALFKNFQEQEKQLLALREFLAASKIVTSEFILQIGSTLPAGIKLTSIDYKPTEVALRGGIEGAPDEASGKAVAYVEELRKNAAISALFGNIGLSSIVRDSASGLIKFEISLKFKIPVKAAAGGKK